jgi:glycosyltransferase involved in cell wall biosynthesis
MPGTSEDFVIFDRPYLLVVNMTCYSNAFGEIFFDRGWYHDLIQHLYYLPAFALAAPCRPLPLGKHNLVRLEEDLRRRFQLIPLPDQRSRAFALLQALPTFWALWRAVGRSDVVHAGIAGWPYPLGWVAGLVAQMRRRKLLIIVESAPWRITSKAYATPLRKKIEASVFESLARYWCSRADLSFYTQPSYLNQFHANGRGPAYVAPATWVNADDILDDKEARALWDIKRYEPVRLLFAGRFAEEKGVRVLLEAIGKLAKAGVQGVVHLIGEGPLKNEILEAERIMPFSVKHFEPLAYGTSFLDFVQKYHAVVVPSLSDEQPRIVFDAAARAVPALASNTDGLRPYVENNRTGALVSPGNSEALAEVMAAWVRKPSVLPSLALEALSRVRSNTHRAMHVRRSRLISQNLSQ